MLVNKRLVKILSSQSLTQKHPTRTLIARMNTTKSRKTLKNPYKS